ncbi:MAG: hypothetical protein MPJ78_19415 [Hyphomicrobiaceae bacterium]|nr:hypothetical protein [Hyphomicrobiaceae bacterium]
MLPVNVLSPTLGLNKSIAETRSALENLQLQLATGKKVQTYGDLGLRRSQVLSTRAELSQIKGFTNTISLLDIRLDVMVQSLDRVRELASESKSGALEVGFDVLSTGKTIFQTEVSARFDEVAALLNTEIDGRHFFGGRAVEEDPVVTATEILNGSGGRAGFTQVSSERRQADLGADGRGRLTLDGPQASILGAAVGTPGDIGGVATAQFTIDIGGNSQTFDVSDGGSDTLAALETAIDAAFGTDVASIVGGNQLQLNAPNITDSITITDIDAGAAALAGLTTGTVANPTGTATVAEDVDGSPFGFKLNGATSTLSGTTVTGPAGTPPSIDVAFTGVLPQDGETIQLTFDLPDGTTHDMTLTARTSGPVDPGEFLVGADADETAANFQSVLDSEVQTEAQRSLSAASLFAAANNFFDFDDANPPQRVNGPPFDTATSLVNATTTDTVFWYTGEVSSTNARQSATAKVDDAISVSVGARANEDALRDVMKTFAAVTSEIFDPNDPDAADRYHEMRLRAATNLSFQGTAQAVDDIITELTVSKTVMGQANERHKASDSLMRDVIGEAEDADIFEVSAQILALQTRLEASLQVSVSMSSLSILNFL